MPFQSGEDRTEPATPKKQQEARQRGQVARSRELSTVAVLLGSLLFFQFMGFRMTGQVAEFMRSLFSSAGSMELNQESMQSLWLWVLSRTGMVLLPIMLVSVLAGVASNVMQVGFLATAEPLKPNLERIDPVRGFGRIFSKQSLMELLKSLLKVIIIGFIAYITVKGEYRVLANLYDMEVASIASYISRISLKILMRSALGIFAIAAMDYAFQRWQYERNLRMTKHEVKDELKQREGDPLTKARVKGIQMKLARQRMMAAVPEADVVVTNPTHVAIALQYKHGLMEAPKVVAKGAGHIAKRIVAVAKEHGVPVLVDKPLAQSLYALVGVGQFIPVQLYRAVAEILAYVYRLERRV